MPNKCLVARNRYYVRNVEYLTKVFGVELNCRILAFVGDTTVTLHVNKFANS
jgi:hypothetical protein